MLASNEKKTDIILLSDFYPLISAFWVFLEGLGSNWEERLISNADLILPVNLCFIFISVYKLPAIEAFVATLYTNYK